MSWQIKNDFLSKESIPDNGNRLLVGNGYLGIRGTLDEHGKEQLAAINLAGIYDQVGDGLHEPLNAPNPLHTLLSIDGTVGAAPEREPLAHLQGLDYRHGIYFRRTAWQTADNTVTVSSCRIAHIQHPHLILSRYCVTASADMEVEISADIDSDIWEIYGSHYSEIDYHTEKDTILCLAKVQNGKDQVAVGRHCVLSGAKSVRRETGSGFRYRVFLQKEKPVTLTSICAVFTTLDKTEQISGAASVEAAPLSILTPNGTGKPCTRARRKRTARAPACPGSAC